MTPVLETLSWIAAIVALPAAVVGWFVPAAQKTTKSVTNKGGTATFGETLRRLASLRATIAP
jgi:hypothetical protein